MQLLEISLQPTSKNGDVIQENFSAFTRGNLGALAIVVGLMLCQQLSGVVFLYLLIVTILIAVILKYWFP